MPSYSQSSRQNFEQKPAQSKKFSPQQKLPVDLLHSSTHELEKKVLEEIGQNPEFEALLEIAPSVEFDEDDYSGDGGEVIEERPFDEYPETDGDNEADLELQDREIGQSPLDESPQTDGDNGADLELQDWEIEQIDWQQKEDAREQAMEYWLDGEDAINMNSLDSSEAHQEFDHVFSKSVIDRLDEQIAMMPALEPPQLRLARLVVRNLDDVGFFQGSIKEFADDHDLDPEETEEILVYLQHRLEPAGIAARDTHECIRLQLHRKRLTESLAYRLLDRQASVLASSESPVVLAKALGFRPIKVQQAFELIKRETTPFPVVPVWDQGAIDLMDAASRWERNSGFSHPMVEARIRHAGGEWIVESERHALPVVRIRPEYAEMAENGSAELIPILERAALEARRWNKLLTDRQSQMIPILKALAEYQNDYLLGHSRSPRPLTYQALADLVVGEEGKPIHKSTANRAAHGKWIDTPIGVIEIQTFFSEKTGLETGQSQNEVKRIIKDLIEKETKTKPLSDEAITDILLSRKIEIARRTVAKYREEMKIASTRVRKQQRM